MSTPKTIRAYHFVSETLRDGTPIPADGVWLKLSPQTKVECCKRGYHASKHPSDALRYAPDNTLCLVELRGKFDEQEDKLCATQRRIIARFDATDLLRAYARECALSVAHLWKMPDIVRQYLETGDESLRVKARKVAAAAAYAAAAYAAATAYAATAYAATATAYAKRKELRARFEALVVAKFKELEV